MTNQIIRGNCIDVMKEIPNNSVEMTLTDIPYDVVNRKSNGLRNLDKGKADILTFPLDDFLKEVVRITKGSIYIWCATEQVSDIRHYMASNKLTTRLCIWQKDNPTPLNGQHMWLSGVECCVYGKKKGGVFNEFCKNTVWRYPCVKKKYHPTEKPILLFKKLIEASSNEGDTIFDPCAGSGTTALAAQQLNRNFIVCEIDEDYVKTIKERLVEDEKI